MQISPSPSPRVYRLWVQYISPQTDSIFSAVGQAMLQGQRTLQGGRPGCRGGPVTGTWPQRDYKHSPKTACQQCGSDPHKSREECRAISQECYHCGRLGDFSNVCRRNPDNCNKTEVNHTDMEEQSPDYTQSGYTTPYYITNDQAKASIKCLKTTAKLHHMHNTDTEHIRPLCVAQCQGSQVYQTDCEVDTGAGCNVLPAHRAQQLFGQE